MMVGGNSGGGISSYIPKLSNLVFQRRPPTEYQLAYDRICHRSMLIFIERAIFRL
jgi:hypothetical protein